MVDLSVIIVNWNTRDLLAQCLQSVYRTVQGLEFEVVVVDNASSDGSAQMVQERFPRVRLIVNTENLGFARSNNQAFTQATGQYLLMLNPDVIVLPGAINELVTFMDAHPEAGIASGVLLNPDGSFQAGGNRFPTLASELRSLAGFARPRRPTRLDALQAGAVDWVGGSFLMARRHMVEVIGLLDEQFYMYCEETDWCFRARQQGWKVYFVPQARIIHYGGQSTRQRRREMLIQLYRSKILLLRKHYGLLPAAIFQQAILALFPLKLLIRRGWREKEPLPWSRLLSYQASPEALAEARRPVADYRCPRCRSELLDLGQDLACLGCGARWPIREGIPCFTLDDFYWGFLPRSEMQEMLEVAACQGWQAGVGYFLDKQPLSERRYYSDYATSEARADWRFLIPLPKQSRVLDIGSGLGAITFALARAGSEIYALDPTYENLRFIEIRREQESLSNLHPVRAETGRLPFPDSYFDLVVMIGVLEWVGDAYPHGDPVRIQQQVLENVQAVLKPGGYLYLAMENRYGYSYLLGRRDEHTNLRFITPLPRVLAALYSHLARRRAYRTYTHSYRTLKGLLGSAGFAKADFYYPVPGYQTPQFIVPLSSNTPFQFLLSTFLRSHHRVDKITYTMGRIVALLSLQRIFCPAFSVLAEKAK